MPNDDFSLDHLTPVQFEEFCFDLLEAMGGTALSWRKGTGFDSSPSDQGRDIECYFRRKDVDGETSERWFVECKHHKSGVPPQKVQSLVTWAAAERPDVALIIASNFLSNSAKDFLDSYKRNNNPAFKLKVWERPDLERFTSGKPLVLRKYGLAGPFDFLNILHPAHVRYLRHPPLNTLNYLFELLDKLEPEERRSFFTGAFLAVINPPFEEPTDPKRQTMGELLGGRVSYTAFRKKCFELAADIGPYFLIQGVIFHELASLFNSGDKTAIQQARENMTQTLELLRQDLHTPGAGIETINACIRDMMQMIENIEERTQASYDQYSSFCDKVVAPLLEEQNKAAFDWLEQVTGGGAEPLE